MNRSFLKTICSGMTQEFSGTRLEPVWGRTQLVRTRVVEKVYNNSSLLLRVAVPYTGPLLAKNTRKMREKEYEESIEAMEIRVKM